MAAVLIVDDHENIRKMISIFLMREGFDTLEAADGAKALAIMEEKKADIIVADIMMPVIDGYELLRILRERGNLIPILMVTAKTDFTDLRHGFELGADDYMTKPVDLQELALRVRALLRRSSVVADTSVTVGSTVLDSGSLEVKSPAGGIVLPQKEFQLLFKLLAYPGKTYTRKELLDDIWGTESESGVRTVDVHISRLRERFSGNPDFEIITVHGLGYKCEARSI